jgi:hypothetical protein
VIRQHLRMLGSERPMAVVHPRQQAKSQIRQEHGGQETDENPLRTDRYIFFFLSHFLVILIYKHCMYVYRIHCQTKLR